LEKPGNGAKGNQFRPLLGRAMREKEMIVFAFPAPFFGSFFGRAKNEQMNNKIIRGLGKAL